MTIMPCVLPADPWAVVRIGSEEVVAQEQEFAFAHKIKNLEIIDLSYNKDKRGLEPNPENNRVGYEKRFSGNWMESGEQRYQHYKKKLQPVSKRHPKTNSIGILVIINKALTVPGIVAGIPFHKGPVKERKAPGQL